VLILQQVKSEIQRRLNSAKKLLKDLGSKRETADEQRQYLLRISEQFQKIVTAALSANYVGNDCFDKHPNLRFATEVVSRNEILAEILEQHGHSFAFDDTKDDSSSSGFGSKKSLESPEYAKLHNGNEKEGKIPVRFQDDPEGIEELPDGDTTIPGPPQENIFKWLTKVYETSRGFELGTFGGSILAMTMKTQSAKWEAIAVAYIKDITAMAHAFIRDLLRIVCPDPRVREALMSVLMDELLAKYRAALDFVHFLLHVERTGTPATVNHYFADNLEKWYVHLSSVQISR
jgi:hypothetical protein